jgi:hypothetical protein
MNRGYVNLCRKKDLFPRNLYPNPKKTKVRYLKEETPRSVRSRNRRMKLRRRRQRRTKERRGKAKKQKAKMRKQKERDGKDQLEPERFIHRLDIPALGLVD